MRVPWSTIDAIGRPADVSQHLWEEWQALIGEHEAGRRSIFRRHLRETVDRASPLLLAVASAEGLALADLVYDFPPHSNWLGSWPGVPPAANRGHQTAVKGRHDAMFLQRHGRDGRILRLPSDPAGRFAITRAGGCLGVTIDVGPCVLKTIGSLGYLSLSLRLPEVVAAAVVDGPLDHWTTGPVDRSPAVRRTGIRGRRCSVAARQSA